MSYREQIEEIVNSLRSAFDLEVNVSKTYLAHYGPKLVDYGIDLDRLHAENERLTAIVNLIELKEDRDKLAKRVAELEERELLASGFAVKVDADEDNKQAHGEMKTLGDRLIEMRKGRETPEERE